MLLLHQADFSSINKQTEPAFQFFGSSSLKVLFSWRVEAVLMDLLRLTCCENVEKGEQPCEKCECRSLSSHNTLWKANLMETSRHHMSAEPHSTHVKIHATCMQTHATESILFCWNVHGWDCKWFLCSAGVTVILIQILWDI